MRYDPKKIEQKWQKVWFKEKIYEPDLGRAKKPFYNLMMFPYPSAEGLHVGNMYAFVGSDIYGRLKRMQGYDVFEPIGLDGFGIHSENYALKIGKHPAEQAKISEKNFYRQLEMIGNGFAWDEKLETYDPDYYKWTQWIFVQMYKRGLAYRKKATVNWCPSCLTVLADEQVLPARQSPARPAGGLGEGGAGECERCSTEVVKKELEQWFFRITNYAERLLQNLNRIDWSERIKIAQKNWMGRSEGALIRFPVSKSKFQIEVFTTRPDTLFGTTYMVLAPEHPLVADGKLQIENRKEVEEYIRKAKTKTEEERIAEGKEKTGVELKGIKAVNPANKEEIPIWVADYVLGHVGTGAIMAVPAHDERDFEFAKKFGLPIKKVIAGEFGKKRPDEKFKDGGAGIVFDPRAQKYAVARWRDDGRITLFAGGVNGRESVHDAIVREVQEESGFYQFGRIEWVDIAYAHFFNKAKQINRFARVECLLFILASTNQKPVRLEDHEDFEVVWRSPDEILADWKKRNVDGDYDHYIEFLREGVARAIALGYDKTNDPQKYSSRFFVGDGFLENSGKFSGLNSEKAKWELTKFVGGTKRVQYRLRDWLISRQRYWGPPIPMIYCKKCGWQPVPEKDLPIRLPYIKEFRPTGTEQAPLAAVEKFYKARCPKCGGWARRETDVSDTFLDSAWYYLRYPSVQNKKNPWNQKITKKWLPVDMYIGGAEHAVLHLLYVRFLAMAFHDWGLTNFEEPFKKFRAHGLLIKDGAKMSKSRGNVVNPDEYIRAYGVDALRMYLMFLGPFEQGGDFRDTGIRGITRFLERVWRLVLEKTKTKNQKGLERLVHKTIKKVTEDIEGLQYNTAISALMILFNKFEERTEAVSKENLNTFLKLLAPFAPYVSEELWQSSQRSKKFKSVHQEPWPKYDSKLIREETFELVIQVNGKVRGRITLPVGVSEEGAKKTALSIQAVRRLVKTEPKKIIFVPNKLISFVI